MTSQTRSTTLFAIFSLSMAAANIAQANGGGYISGIKSTSAFKPKNAEKVAMLTEKLDINLYDSHATVNVVYTMENTGGDVTVEAGFPCSITTDVTADEAEARELIKKRPVKLDGFELVADGKPLTSKFVMDDLEFVNSGEGDSTIVKGWYVFRLAFKKGQKREFKAKYTTPYYFEQTNISDDSYHSGDKFSYLFSSAALWAGPIKEGTVTITSHRPADAYMKINQEKRFQREANVWTWKFTDFEPTLKDDLQITLSESEFTKVEYSPEQERSVCRYKGVGCGSDRSETGKWGGKWEVEMTDYDVTASSTLKPDGELTYDAKNVQSFFGDQAWVEGVDGDGIGQKLTLTFKKPKTADKLTILNGYNKTEALYYSNNRVAELKMTINGGEPTVVSLPDSGPSKPFSIDLPKNAGPINEVTLTINKVHPGKKYKDTCISGIYFSKHLEKEPDIQPAR